MTYTPRLVDQRLRAMLGTFPAVLVTGSRAVGKTTTAERASSTVVRLDRPRDAAAFEADPDVALRRLDEPVLLDEWQEVPTVLAAVKRAVDEDPRPGRFILTGSVRTDLDTPSWPGTGRLIRIRMEPMILAERAKANLDAASGMVDQLFEDGAGSLADASCDLALDGYLDAAFAGGLPPLLDLAREDGQIWLGAYIDQLVTRDAARIDGSRDPEGLRRWLRAYASSVATVADQKTIYDAAGVAKATGEAYAALMEALLIATPVPAWWTNELKRLAKRPKLHLVDAALVGALLGLDTKGALRDGRHGPMLETFVVGQLRAMAAVARVPTRVYHLRHLDGHEVDIVLERADRRLVAIEVKAASAPTRRDAKNLRWLRNKWGARVAATIVAHTGPRAFDLGDHVMACPIGALAGL